MSCQFPKNRPMEEQNRHILLYTSCSVGLSQEERAIAIVFNGPDERSLSPAILCSEKEAVHLLDQLQTSIQLLAQLPLVSLSPLD